MTDPQPYRPSASDVHLAVVRDGLWSARCAREAGWSVPLADFTHEEQVTCPACTVRPGAVPTTCTCGCVFGATVEVWPHGSKGDTAEQQQGRVVDVVDIDGRKHLVVGLDA